MSKRNRREPMTPSERSLRARIGAYAMHARNDPRQTTASARAAFLERFVREVDPHRSLAAPERHRRAEAARKAYFSRLAYASARRRNRRRRSRNARHPTDG
jgi:hypothetical protein